jgi:triosephosphate isomerase
VILGHSERRQHFCESDEALARKLPAALAANLQPILCVGESEQERERDQTEERLRAQIEADLAEVDSSAIDRIVIAYEPIWAIGTGKTATLEQAQQAIAFLRSLLRDRHGDVADRTRIVYGGSVNTGNARELLGAPDIDGALVGGASLDAESFADIAAAAGS